MDDETEEGEFIEINDDDSDVTDTPDGGALVTLGGDDAERDRSDDFMMNLAAELPEPVLDKLAGKYLELIEKDKEARKKRDEQYEMGLRRTTRRFPSSRGS